MARRRIVYSLIATLLVAGPVYTVNSQSREDWRATENQRSKPSEKATPQKYDGVTPGSGNSLPKVEELKTKPGTWVTWPGFRSRSDGASQIFLQTTGAVEFQTIEKKKRITIKLKNAKVHLSNNRNPLVTTHFNTPLKRAYLKKRRKNLELILELKQETTYQLSQSMVEDGYNYLFIDFPPGNYAIVESVQTRPSFEGYGGSEEQSENGNSEQSTASPAP